MKNKKYPLKRSAIMDNYLFYIAVGAVLVVGLYVLAEFVVNLIWKE